MLFDSRSRAKGIATSDYNIHQFLSKVISQKNLSRLQWTCFRCWVDCIHSVWMIYELFLLQEDFDICQISWWYPPPHPPRVIIQHLCQLPDGLIDWMIEYGLTSMKPSKDYTRLHSCGIGSIIYWEIFHPTPCPPCQKPYGHFTGSSAQSSFKMIMGMSAQSSFVIITGTFS